MEKRKKRIGGAKPAAGDKGPRRKEEEGTMEAKEMSLPRLDGVTGLKKIGAWRASGGLIILKGYGAWGSGRWRCPVLKACRCYLTT